MSRAARIQRRVYRKVQAKSQPFLARPKHVQELPARSGHVLMLTVANKSMLESIGEGSASDGLEILCDAFRGGLKYLRDGRRKKK